MRQISDRTLDAQLDQRMRKGKVSQLFMRRLGPGDVVYVSAHVFSPGGETLIVKATAATYAQAFDQLWRNIDAVGIEGVEP